MELPKDTVISINNPNKKVEHKAEINILCFNLSPYSPLTQFVCSAVFVLVCYLAYGYFLELIFSKPEVKPVSLYITLVQFLITTILSYVESLIRDPIKRKVPITSYALLAALTLGTMALSNLALSYLNYPTQLIFKSCKLIPVMVGSMVILNKRYAFLDYAAAALMCFGLTMFILADSQTSPKFDAAGVVVISLALVCDAIIGNVQEKAMKQHQASNNEVVFFSYGIASGYLLLLTAPSGVLRDGLAYCSTEPARVYGHVALLGASGYCGLQGVLALVRVAGAAAAASVTAARKAVSVLLSFLLFDKPFVFQYAWSGALVLGALYLAQLSRRRPGYSPAPLAAARRLAAACCHASVRTKLHADTV